MATEQTTRPPHVGTLGVSSLHRALKRWYAQPGDRVEVPIEWFVADLVRGDTQVEIQTSGFSSMGRKLDTLLDHHDRRTAPRTRRA